MNLVIFNYQNLAYARVIVSKWRDIYERHQYKSGRQQWKMRKVRKTINLLYPNYNKTPNSLVYFLLYELIDCFDIGY